VYADKLMIWNPGILPPDWDVAKLLAKHASQPFNPDVANAFFRAGMIESWGRGIERIMDACAAAGAPAPLLQYEQSGLWITFNFPAEQSVQTTEPETPGKTPPKTPLKTPLKTPDRILMALRQDGTLSIPEIASQIGKSESAVKRAIRKLREEGKLERIGPAKGGHWKVLEDKE
ncbi:MAG: ATP-binding protein, partial [Candidatus Sedimenticola sp. (ex Thyasira tokunagai)]